MFNFVIPTDFTEENRETIFRFFDIFFKENKEASQKIILLNAFDTPNVGQSMMLNMDEMLDDFAQEDLEKERKLFDERYKGVANYKISTYARKGTLTNVLHRYDNKEEIDFAVLSYKSESFFNKIFKNDELNPSKIVNSLNEPVLFVPREEEVRGINSIMFCVDLEFFSNEQDFKLFLELAKHFKASIDFVHINTGAEENINQKFNEIYTPLLIDFKEKTRFIVVEASTLAEGYREYVNEYDPDMVVLIERKSDFFKSFLGDSFVDEISSSLNRNLLVISEKYDDEGEK